MTFAAYIAWLMDYAFTQVLPSDEADDAFRAVTSDFSTQPWYEAHVFSRIAEQVSQRMPKSIVELVECGANACGHTLMHQTDFELMVKFQYCSRTFITSMKELASSPPTA